MVQLIRLWIAGGGHCIRIDYEIRREVATQTETVTGAWLGRICFKAAVAVHFDRFIADGPGRPADGEDIIVIGFERLRRSGLWNR